MLNLIFGKRLLNISYSLNDVILFLQQQNKIPLLVCIYCIGTVPVLCAFCYLVVLFVHFYLVKCFRILCGFLPR